MIAVRVASSEGLSEHVSDFLFCIGLYRAIPNSKLLLLFFSDLKKNVFFQFIDLCILLGCDYCDSIRGERRGERERERTTSSEIGRE